MVMIITPEELKIILPTVGCECELHAIRFLVIRKNKIIFVGNEKVLSVFNSILNGIACAHDANHDPRTPAELKRIAAKENLSLTKKKKTSYIFEFITHPKNDAADIDHQFNSLTQIETNLIEYLLTYYHQTNYNLLPVKDWLKQFPKDQLSADADANHMHILLDYSIQNLQLSNIQKNSNNLHQIAQDVQRKLKHHVQFNFVVALGTRMGSMLVEMMGKNNNLSKYKENLDNILINIGEIKQCDISKEPFKTYLQDAEKHAEQLINKIAKKEKQISILLQSENNAENACIYIRSQARKNEIKNSDAESSDDPAHRKLIKLEGFFFILSMRILTETNYITLGPTETPKNKYPFFLKTQLSDLIDSLSENDKALLFAIQHTWSDKQKNDLLARIAGSHQALTVQYHMGEEKDFTVKDVIESALGWRNDRPNLCNWFPGASIKPLIPRPVEPEIKGLRSKKHKEPLQRVLLEYRHSKNKTLSNSLKEMKNMLNLSANFCKTTYLHKQRLDQLSQQEMVEYLMMPDEPAKEKASFVQMLNLYRPSILSEIRSIIPEEIENIEAYQQDLDEKNKTHFLSGERVDVNTNKAMELILSDESLNLKEKLQELILSSDTDLTLKQINYLYLLTSHSEHLSQDRKASVERILIELYSEKIFSHFKFPLESSQIQYVNYIMKFYPITNHILDVSEFFKLFKLFSKEYPTGFSVDARDHQKFTMLDHACQNGLSSLVDNLLAQGAKAITHNLIDSLSSGILTPELATRLIQAGANPTKSFYYLAKLENENSIVNMIKIVGEHVLRKAMNEYQDKPHVIEKLLNAYTAFKNEKLTTFSSDSTMVLRHSVTFVSTDSKEPNLPHADLSPLNPPKSAKKNRNNPHS